MSQSSRATAGAAAAGALALGIAARVASRRRRASTQAPPARTLEAAPSLQPTVEPEPDAAQPRAQAVGLSRHRLRRPGGRVVATILACGVATAGMLGGSYASWTAQTTNPANSVSAGTLTMNNNKNATAVFSASNIKPGDTGSSTVTVTNSGSLPMAVTLTQGNVTSTGIEASLRLSVHDATRNYCYWPTQAPGACPSLGAWNAAATLNALPIAATDGSARWPASQSHTFTVAWELLTSSPNSDQGKTASFDLTWGGAQ